MKILIKNGRLVDPASGLDQVGDLAITASRITALGNVSADFEPDRVIDATGLIVAPGLVDLAARLREPGHEHEGMLESELAAAAAGGVTSRGVPARHRPDAGRARPGRDAQAARREAQPVAACSRWAP